MQNLLRPSVFVLLIVLLIGCAPTAVSTPTPISAIQPTAEASLPTPTVEQSPVPVPTNTPVPPDPTLEPPVQATVEVTIEISETAVAPAIPQNIPTTDDLDHSVFTQFGGVFQTIELDNQLAYVGVGARVAVLNISDPSNVQLLGKTGLLDGLVKDIEIEPNSGLLYVASEQGGLAVVNVTNPTFPEIISVGPTYAGAGLLNAETVFIYEQTAFVLDGYRYDQSSELLRFDISNPTAPALLDTISLPDLSRISHWQDIIFVQHDNGIDFLDVTDPTSQLANISISQDVYGPYIEMVGNIAYVSVNNTFQGMYAYDLSDPLHPIQMRPPSVELFNSVYSTASDTHFISGSIFGEFGFCASTVSIIDVQETANIFKTTEFDPQNCLTDTAVSGDYLYLTGRSGLSIYDISDPSAQRRVSLFTMPNDVMDVQAVANVGQYYYVLSSEGRGYMLTTLDIAQPANPIVGTPIAFGAGSALDLYVQGDYLFVPVWMSGFYIFDISTPSQPVLITEQTAESISFATGINTFALFDDFLVTPYYGDEVIGGMVAIGFSDPENLTSLSQFETGIGEVLALRRSENLLYVLSQGAETAVHIFDLTDPTNPQQLSELLTSPYYSRLAFHNGDLYAYCDGWSCTDMGRIDVSNPAEPIVTHQWQIPFQFNQMVSYSDSELLVMGYDEGSWLMDVSDLENVVLNGRIQTNNPSYGIKVVNESNMLAVPAFEGGLYLVRIGE